MKRRQRFDILYAPAVKGHMKAIERKYYSLIRNVIERQLRFEPDVETRNRKPLKRPNLLGTDWEIRFGPDCRFRVFYQVDRNEGKVFILAVGQKVGSRLIVGGEEMEL